MRKKIWETTSLRDGLALFRAQPPRVHLLMFDEQGVQESMQQSGVRLAVTPLEVERRPLHLMFSKQRVGEEVVARMNAAIERLQQDGRLADALLKAGLHSSQHPVSQQP